MKDGKSVRRFLKRVAINVLRQALDTGWELMWKSLLPLAYPVKPKSTLNSTGTFSVWLKRLLIIFRFVANYYYQLNRLFRGS